MQTICKRFRSAILLFMLLASVSSIAMAAEVIDARRPSAYGAFNVRNDARGATLPVEDRQIGRDLVARVQDRLQSVGTAQLGDAKVRITRADATLFIEGAIASPASASIEPAVRHLAQDRPWNDLVELRYVSPNSRKAYRVVVEGEVDGRAFSVSREVQFRGSERRQLLDRVISEAVEETVRMINPGAQPSA